MDIFTHFLFPFLLSACVIFVAYRFGFTEGRKDVFKEFEKFFKENFDK